MAAITGICIMIKYPAAILCFYIAFVVVYKSIKDKKYKEIAILAVLSIGIIAAVMFVIAPNLFTDMPNAISTFLQEARPNHLGSDGLGVGGNLLYYLQTVANDFGYLSIVYFAAGVLFLVFNRHYEHFAILVSAAYWVCLSFLALHWLRWGIPMFTGFVIVVAIGIVWLFHLVYKHLHQRALLYQLFSLCFAAIVTLSAVNLIISGLAVTRYNVLKDTRVTAMEYCKEHNINGNNSIFEGYTPLSPTLKLASTKYQEFEWQDGKLRPIKRNASKKYFVLSSSFWWRYAAESGKYSDEAAVYNGLNEYFPLLYMNESYNYYSSPMEIRNIISGCKYLFSAQADTGNNIYIFDLQPELVEIHPLANDSLCLYAGENQSGTLLELSDNSYSWGVYNDGEWVTFIAQDSNKAIEAVGVENVDGAVLQLADVKDTGAQKWRIQQETDYVFIFSPNNMVLTYEDNALVLKPFTGYENQRWFINKV